jgi:hypothetical protein
MPPLKPVSQLDANQVLQHAFDESSQRLRTDAEATIVNADIDVTLDATEDSVAIGDKDTGDTLKVNPDGSINVVPSGNLSISTPAAEVPTITNLSMVSSLVEYSYEVPENTKKIYIKSRTATVRLAFNTTETATNYITIPYGSSFSLENLQFNGTLYVKSSKNSDTLEIMTWS